MTCFIEICVDVSFLIHSREGFREELAFDLELQEEIAGLWVDIPQNVSKMKFTDTNLLLCNLGG